MKIDFFSVPTIKNIKKTSLHKTRSFSKYFPSTASAIESPDACTLPEQDFPKDFQDFDLLLAHRSDAYKKSQTLLALLTTLRIDLLNGNIPYSRIQQLHHFLHSLPKDIDPSLKDILDEITLRVQIELTKIEKIT